MCMIINALCESMGCGALKPRQMLPLESYRGVSSPVDC